MFKYGQRRWLALLLCVLTAGAGLCLVHGALLTLDAFTVYSILEHFGFNPIAQGSIVYIVGSGDDVVNDPGGMAVFPPGGGTNLIADSATGDDVILGMVRVGDNNTSNGTFFTSVQYDPSEVSYAYIRFFEYTGPEPVTGLVWWGTSAVYELVPTLGVARVDFNPGVLQTTQINNFVIVPEPGTGNLMILFFGMLGSIRARVKRIRREEALQAA